MVNKLSIAALVTGAVTLAIPSVMAREFKTFEEYQEWERDLHEHDEDRKIENTRLRREYGTFWNPWKAAGFDGGHALKNGDGSDIKGCAVAVYYDSVDLRNIQKNHAGGEKDATTWIKPLGVTPVCGEGAGAPGAYKGPRTPGADPAKDSMLFSNYKGNTDLDTYLVLNQLDENENKDKDCLKMEDFKGQQIQWGGEAKEVKKIWGDNFGDADLRDWFTTYVQNTHSGCIINPYKVSRGDVSWSNYNQLGEFWGYDDNGLWKDIKGDSRNIKKRSRAQGVL